MTEEEKLRLENSELKRRLDEIAEAETETRKKIDGAFREAENARRAAEYAYATELSDLKAFSKKWRDLFSSDDTPVDKKNEMIDLLNGFLDKIGLESAKDTIKKISEKLGGEDKVSAQGENEYEFDLSEAINPSGELDLEELCRELGVYKG